MPRDASARRHPDGPPLGPVATVALGLALIGVLLPAAIAGRVYPSPFESSSQVTGYFADHPFAAVLTALFTFGSAIPLAIVAASASVRLNRLGVRVPGPTIALAGGLLASASLAISGLVTWVLSRPELADAGAGITRRALHDLAFALGGPGFVVPLGLLLAGIAVPSVIVGLVPRWLAWAGLALAAVCEVATLTLLWDGFTVLLPVGRFLGLVWLVVVGFALPRDRREVPRGERRAWRRTSH
ncbi:hypothetical protein D7I44_08660 [Gryllotalpicola protaetiae]|uniref:DUF4386 domain-containing protein n=2 Tax=Gryllotalpicola protaetiae TaxID=2419771 RepID=A0A387BRM9_9MICO|nr:hypothetical protein D7I44_08660 [Gryllotalpicola protaetiae]